MLPLGWRTEWKRHARHWASANLISFLQSNPVPGNGYVELYPIDRWRLPHEDRFDTDGVRLMFLSPFNPELDADALGARGVLSGCGSPPYGELPTRLWPSNILVRTDFCEKLVPCRMSLTEILDLLVVSSESTIGMSSDELFSSVYDLLRQRMSTFYFPTYNSNLITRLRASILVWKYNCPVHGTQQRVMFEKIQLRAFLCSLYERCVTTNVACREEFQSIKKRVALGYRFRLVCPYEATTDFFCMEKHYSFESVLALMCSDTAPENYSWRGIELPVNVYGLPDSDFDPQFEPPDPIDV